MATFPLLALLISRMINANIQCTAQEKEETPKQNQRFVCGGGTNEYPLDSL